MLFIFLAVQAIGLYCGYQYLQLIKTGEAQPGFGNPENAYNSLFLFVYIILTTLVIIAIIKYKKSLLKYFEMFAVFFASLFAFELLFMNDIIALPLAIALTVWKVRKPTIVSQDVALIFSVSGAGAILGGSLGVFPVLIFLFLLSVYDFVSVFITKHMVYMAKAITERPMAFTAAVPTRSKKWSHTFQLGGGDLVMPLILTIAVLNKLGPYHALFTFAGGFIALAGLMAYVLRKPGEPLPALPPICAGACVGLFVAGMLFGV